MSDTKHPEQPGEPTRPDQNIDPQAGRADGEGSSQAAAGGSHLPDFSALDPDRMGRDEGGGGGGGGGVNGMLEWITKNSVAANILMIIFIAGGLFMARDIKQEVFPEFDLDLVLVTVPYPGASPEEVETGVLLAVEESIRGLDGVKKVTSSAAEGVGSTVVELMRDANPDQALNDIKAGIDRITSFPQDIEEPQVQLPRLKNQVLALVLYGDESEMALKDLAEQARDQLLNDDRITVVEIGGVRAREVSIEVPQEQLRRYGLTLDQIAGIVRQSSIELPGGGLKTSSGEVLLRTAERRDSGAEFEAIELLSEPDGSTVYLGDIATVQDGFAETDQETRFDGKRAVTLQVFRVGDETPIDVSEAVHEYIDNNRELLPPGIEMAVWVDQSSFYKQRRDLLYRNALIGLVLVLLVLGLFLEVKLAFWVTMGIPISFIGSLLFLPVTDVSLNMISLFAFILVLGMVVDDAIIVGEAIYRWREDGLPRMEAAIRGVKEVSVPVFFAIVTTVVAYTPMLFVPGVMGKFFRVIPMVVILVLIMSLVESLLILPAHLAHSKRSSNKGFFGFISHQQERFSRLLQAQIQRVYIPVVVAAVRRRYLTATIGVAVLAVTVGLMASGRVETEFFPSVDTDVVTLQIEMPYGTAIERTREVHDHVLEGLYKTYEDFGGKDRYSRGIIAYLASADNIARAPGAQPATGSHLIEISTNMVSSDQRSFIAKDVERTWRGYIGEIPGVERIKFIATTGPSSGVPINIEISHPNLELLRTAAEDLAAELSKFAGTYDIDDGFTDGKPQLDLELTAEGRSLGLTETDLARQIRSAFFGAEALRQQRGRDEVRVYVRLPRDERDSEFNIEELIIRTPAGGEIPLARAAHIERGQSYTSIRRIDGRRAVSVTAGVDDAIANADKIKAEIDSDVLPAWEARYPTVTHAAGGEARDQQQTMGSLMWGLLAAVLVIYALLAVVFRSYMQPAAVLVAIPFGVVGAVLGHLIMGFKVSLMSMMGIVALSGVVVNDSLILIVAINTFRANGMSLSDAVVAGGAVRFRPIVLTSLTTFFGLAPMILETSVQARFLIPMAVSLGFGIIFATVITLVLVPAAYMILESCRRVLGNRLVILLLLFLPPISILAPMLFLFGVKEPIHAGEQDPDEIVPTPHA
ncbi:MAG: efflux RND transporter permease subunit [Haliangiales bacterium]